MAHSALSFHSGRGYGKSYLISQYGKLLGEQRASPQLNISPYTIRFYFPDTDKVVLKRSKKSMAIRFCTPCFEDGKYCVQWDRQEDSNIPGVMMGELRVPMEFLLERMDQAPPVEGHLTKTSGRHSASLPPPPKRDRRYNLLYYLNNDYGLAYCWNRTHSVPVPRYIHVIIVDMFLEQIKPLGL